MDLAIDESGLKTGFLPSGADWPKAWAGEKGPSSWYGKRRDVVSDHRILCLAGSWFLKRHEQEKSSWFEKARAGVGMTRLEILPMG
jgi:hypothetical protein